MTTPTLSSLPITRYRFTARMQAPLRLPDYAGSLLRGQFGASLRRLACMTRQSTCSGCPLQSSCPYTRIFEAPPPPEHSLQKFSAIPNAYIIEPPPLTPPGRPATVLQVNDFLVFHMVLVGSVTAQLPLITFAWQTALARGLGTSRSPSTLEQVDVMGADGLPVPIWHFEHPQLLEHPSELQIPVWPKNTTTSGATETATSIVLNIQTPLRLQQQGHPIRPAELTPRTLLAAVVRRAALMLEFHAGQSQWGQLAPAILLASQTLTDHRRLHWLDWTRYSSRQRQEMTLGGVVGQWQLRGPQDALATLWPWLWLGQWLHVGKNATMGMGHYTLSPTFVSPSGAAST